MGAGEGNERERLPERKKDTLHSKQREFGWRAREVERKPTEGREGEREKGRGREELR